ncbi:uncharacterized protein [Diadema antillarum]|uniref:uncharacterized protein n=1 Tax=Diadema antillarum TaxID=105358 RepID=UPI003A83F0C9
MSKAVDTETYSPETATDATKWAATSTSNMGSHDVNASDHHLIELAQGADDAKMEEEKESFRDKINSNSCPEKTIYILAVLTVVLVTWTMTSHQWLLPYLYTGYLSIVVPIRIWKYVTIKWVCFMCDWCYCASAVFLVYIWAVPSSSSFFTVVFALANGPVAWSTVLFRNCLVPHSIERMTCLIVHFFPALVTFVIRWHPAKVSASWYRDFAVLSLGDVSVAQELVWVVLVPLGCYMLHVAVYIAVFVGIIDSKEYLNNYSYLVKHADGCVSKTVKKGGKWKLVVYLALQLAYGSLSISVSWLLIHFWIAHLIFILILFTAITYNGSTYYLDLFPKKLYNSDPYRICGRS